MEDLDLTQSLPSKSVVFNSVTLPLRNTPLRSAKEMKKVTSKPIFEAPKANGETEVIGVNYDLYNLTIGLTDGGKNSILVVFQEPIGFRVLEERDLNEFWPSCSTPNGWAFQIIEGGWHDHEKKREGYLTPQMFEGAKEYLFTGVSECVSVISESEPQFFPQKAEPVVMGNG